MNSLTQAAPTHDEIARLAHRLWTDRGCPTQADTSTWLEAEQQLTALPFTPAATQRDAFADLALAPTPTAHPAGHQPLPVSAVEAAITHALQKKDARAAQTPHHTGPKHKPAETGKPIWNQPHSN